MINRLTSRVARVAAMGLVVAGVAACSTFDNILEVQNPEELNEEILDGNSALLDVLVNSVTGEFEDALDDPFIWRGSMFTDETLTGINWEQTARLNQRIVEFDEGDADLMFYQISRARQIADSVGGRMREAGLTSDARYAKTLAYAGYSYILLADAMCQATVNVGSDIYEPLELYQFAVDRFTAALAVAGTGDLATMARVGLSRAQLNLGNYAAAITAAQAVPDDFRWYALYTDANPDVYNVLESRVTGNNHSLGVSPQFLAGGPERFGQQNLTEFLTDPRVQHLPDWRLGHNQLTPLYTPSASLMMSNYNGETRASGGTPADIERDSDIAFASGLEARHNMFEAMMAQGGNDAAVLAFVNERRAVGNQDPVTLSGNALKMELRDQRGRDLYLAGHRLGDLRRWLRQGDDMFPSGVHPVDQWSYGNATCFPLPREEYEGNPNINLPG